MLADRLIDRRIAESLRVLTTPATEWQINSHYPEYHLGEVLDALKRMRERREVSLVFGGWTINEPGGKRVKAGEWIGAGGGVGSAGGTNESVGLDD